MSLDKIDKKKMNSQKVNWQSITPHPIIGVDEVGRGCLAGRVYAAAVILSFPSEKYTDSKLLSENRREEIAKEIIDNHRVGIGYASVEEIDKLNILKASLLAMKRAIENLSVKSGHVLVDGQFKVHGLDERSFYQTCYIKGDLRVEPIGAASIVAKVTRDKYMESLSRLYPQYGFEKHKGYSTEVHKKQIEQHGPSAEHRKTFRGVREFLPQIQETTARLGF